MSTRHRFEIPAAALADFVSEHRLGIVVSPGAGGPQVTPLPLLCDVSATGEVTTLVGHFAAGNPHVETVRRHPRATILMLGPHGYIPTRWVSQPGWAPTWNYALAQFEVEITLTPAENGAAIERLVAALEGSGDGAWRVERMGARYAPMLQRVVAFRAAVLSARTCFKLGQDESDRSFAEIVTALGDVPLAGLMRRHRSST